LLTRTYGGSAHVLCSSAQQTADGGFVLGGYTNSYGAGNSDSWLIRLAPNVPLITSITDVGNDQGRQARIRWHRSSQDQIGSLSPILNYSIYRRIDLYRNTDPDRPLHDNLDWHEGDWEFIANVPAYTEEAYTVIAPMLADSTSEGIYWSTFFVRAATANPGIYFDSPVDSGYSVDNLAPEPTLITAGLEIVGSNIVLRWDEVTTGGGGQPEQNGIWYRVYGSTDPEFIPESGNLLTTTQNLSYAHPITDERFYFKVLVSDDH